MLSYSSETRTTIPTYRLSQCCGPMKFWYGSGSADPYHLIMDPNPDKDTDPAIFLSDLQDVNKKLYFAY